MPILNIQVGNIGMSGIVPQFIYIETSDTSGQVQVAGYLNGYANQELPLSQQSMALVSITNSPYCKIYNVSYDGTNWSLVPV
jgi:hypothetical protein